MDVAGKVAVVTGAARGIGAAVAERLALAGASVALTDIDAVALDDTAARIAARTQGSVFAVGADVAVSPEVARVLDVVAERLGPVDLYVANAGARGDAGIGQSDAAWQRALDVNVLAHVRAARLLLPGWTERGAGYFVSTASAAGLLTQLGMAQYSVTKHAAVAFAEWLSITYGRQGVKVSCVCPMGVATELLYRADGSDRSSSLARDAVIAAGEVLAPDDVADAVMAAIDRERFLVLPHPEVLDMYRQRAADPEHWMEQMRRYQDRLLEPASPASDAGR